METTFTVGINRRLRIGHNVCEPNCSGGGGFIGILLEQDVPPPVDVDSGPHTTRYEQVAYLKPHEARAMASVLLSAATEMKA